VKALLLAAGLGTRMKPMTNKVPKCLAPINGKPLLDIWLDNLTKVGIKSFLINTHHLADKVKIHTSKNIHRERINLAYEETLLGTAGTLRSNISFFNNQDGLLIHADNYCLADFKEFIRVHNSRPKGCLLTMMIFETKEPQSCGIVELDHKGIVSNFFEKVENPPGNLANGAIYMLSDEFLSIYRDNFENAKDFSIDVIPHLLGKIFTYKTSSKLIDIGTMKTYDTLNKKLL